MPMRSFLLLLLVATLFDVGLGRDDGGNEDQPTYKLSTGLSIPLVGYGIGNLSHDRIPDVVAAQLRAGVFLVDTARASRNEDLIAAAVDKFDGGRARTRGGVEAAEKLAPLHVVTKVWYTHLGYDRTARSIRESLASLAVESPRQIYVHMLLHWPRCDDAIPWMNCAAEEDALPQSVKDLGPPPHLDKDNAFKHSWQAMEDAYAEHSVVVGRKHAEERFSQAEKNALRAKGGHDNAPLIASIGVSNFELADMKELMLFKHTPQMYQGSSWKAFHDPHLMDHLRERQIFYQAYGALSGILKQQDRAPHAYHALSGLAREVGAAVAAEGRDLAVTEATVVLAYFLRKGVGVVPRAADPAHRREDSPRALSAVQPHLTDAHLDRLEQAIPALLKGEDRHIKVAFTNALARPIKLHWVDPDTQEEHLVSEAIDPGGAVSQRSHPGHKFVAYDADRAVRREFVVDAAYGERQSFSVEL